MIDDKTLTLLNDIEFLYDGARRFNDHTYTGMAYDMLQTALDKSKNNLRGFIIGESEKEIVYEYKLTPRYADGIHFNAGLKTLSKNGKSWRKRGDLNMAITTWINDVTLAQLSPKHTYNTIVSLDGKREYKRTAEYIGYLKVCEVARQDKEYRSAFIPNEWLVLCIPINTKGDIKVINAREFYLGAKP